MKRVSVFVDVQNIYYTTKQIYNAHFDYNVFWSKVTSNRQVVKAISYAVERNDIRQKQFQNILKGIGFEVKLKPYLQRSDGTAKADWDVGITLDIMEFAADTDIVVLASGDGDFDLLVNKIRSKYGVQVEVYGVRKVTSTSLITAASAYVPIEGDLLIGIDRIKTDQDFQD
jgi:uncharacterized LabA/DUF88 family protein